MPSVGGTHHVKIGDHYYLLRPGSWRKKPAPMFGSRFTTGDPDYNNLGPWQHWAQTCWIGGWGADTWRDENMVDEALGVDSSQHEVMTLSRDLALTDSSGFSTTLMKRFTLFNGNLYVLQGTEAADGSAKLWKYNPTLNNWSLGTVFPANRGAVWMEEFAGYLVFGTSSGDLVRMSTGEVFSTFAKPSGITNIPYMLKTYRGKLYVGFGRQIWRLKNDFTWDGSTAFHTAEDIDYLNHAEIHLGLLYMVSMNGHVLRTDGNNTFDLWAFESHVQVWSLRSFDGRLFIATADAVGGTNNYESVLYQMSGAAVTELKRWGRSGYNVTPGHSLRSYRGKLFFGASNLMGMGPDNGFGIGMYDPVEDAHHMFASNRDDATYAPGTAGINNSVDDVIFWNGYLFASTRGHGVFRTPWTHQDATRALALYDNTASGIGVGAQNGGWYRSSDFDAGTPGLLKRWNGITVHIDLPHSSTSAFLEYSTDGGVTWSAGTSITKTGAATRYATFIQLGTASAPVDATRFKYAITLRTTNTAYSPQLRGVIVRYLPIPEPNWMYDMRILLTQKQQLMDRTTESPNNATKIAALRSAFRNQTILAFTEPDGTVCAQAVIHDMQEFIPVIRPTADGSPEYEVQLTVLEMVEAYE